MRLVWSSVKRRGCPGQPSMFPPTLHEFTSRHVKSCQDESRPEDRLILSLALSPSPQSKAPHLAAASPGRQSADHTEPQAAPRTPVAVHSDAQS